MIKLLQLLCPERHCLFGVLMDDTLATEEEAKAGLWTLYHSGPQQHCGLCGSKTFHLEARNTTFKTMLEAMPIVAAEQAANRATKEAMDAIGVSFDAKQQKKN